VDEYNELLRLQNLTFATSKPRYMFRLEIFTIRQVSLTRVNGTSLVELKGAIFWGPKFFDLKFVIIEINNKNIKLLEITSTIKFKTSNTKIHLVAYQLFWPFDFACKELLAF
jgi:hypothetical protein